MDCDNLDALTLPSVVAIKPTIPTLDRIDWSLAVSLHPAAVVTSAILVIKHIAIAACVSVPLGLVTLATPCIIPILYDIGLARLRTPKLQLVSHGSIMFFVFVLAAVLGLDLVRL